jgi:WD40 repeat protein/tetratricopeptide (TPR) repeat protein
VADSAPLTPPLPHRLEATYAAFSRDGKRLVTASGPAFGPGGGEARVWDAITGAPLTEPLVHEGRVASAAFSPDGRLIVTAGAGANPATGVAQLWDAASGRRLGQAMTHRGPITRACFSPDGRSLLTASQDGTARLWRVPSGAAATAPLLHRAVVSTAAFSPDGTRVVTACLDGTAQIWDAVTGNALGSPLTHAGPVQWAAFSPDGGRVVTASGDPLGDDGGARVWDAHTGMPLTPLLAHQGAASFAAFAPDGRRLVTLGNDKIVRLWDTAIAPAVRPFKDLPPGRPLIVTPSGRRAVVAQGSVSLVLCDPVAGTPLAEPLPQTKPVREAHWSDDGRRFLTIAGQAPQGDEVQVWDAATGRPVGALLPAQATVPPPHYLAASGDARFVALAAPDGTVQVWDAESGQAAGPPVRCEAAVEFAALSPDGRRLATARGLPGGPDRGGGEARIWDTATGKALTPPLPYPGGVFAMRFSGDGGRLLVVSNTISPGDMTGLGEARVWGVATGKAEGPPLKHRAALTAAAFSPDAEGRLVLTASRDGTARAWTPDGQPATPPLRHGEAVAAARFSPDGRYLLTTGLRTLRLWETATGDPVSPPLPVLPDSAPAFDEDGGAVVMTSAGTWEQPGEVWRWDLRPEDEAAADLRRDVCLLAGRRVDATGGFVPLEASALSEGLDEARGRRPEDFSAPADAVLAWHLWQMRSAGLGDLSAALWHTGRLIEADPARPASYLERGLVEMLGRPEPAAANFTRALDRGADAARCLYWRGLAHEQLGQVEPAHADYAEAVRLTPAAASAWAHRGATAAALKRFDEAAADCGKALEWGAEPLGVWPVRGAAHAELGQWDRAAEDFRRIFTADPNKVQAAYSMALADLAAGNAAAYRKDCADILQRYSQWPNLTADMANSIAWSCVLAPGAVADSARVVHLAEEAVKAGPGNAAFKNTLGAALYRAGQYDKALAQLDAAIKKQGVEGTPGDWLFLALAHGRLGHAEARQWLDRAVRKMDEGKLTKAEGGRPWQERTELLLLRREAEEFLKPETP